jgi:hypothetical protein
MIVNLGNKKKKKIDLSKIDLSVTWVSTSSHFEKKLHYMDLKKILNFENLVKHILYRV